MLPLCGLERVARIRRVGRSVHWRRGEGNAWLLTMIGDLERSPAQACEKIKKDYLTIYERATRLEVYL